jgi:hypothetical protein
MSPRRTRLVRTNYLLGGKDNYAADRADADAVLKVWPNAAFAVRANRAFLGRAVRYLAAEAGIRQFLDIGAGLPTASNVHKVAQAVGPESKVVYVDYGPMVPVHGRALLVSCKRGSFTWAVVTRSASFCFRTIYRYLVLIS